MFCRFFCGEFVIFGSVADFSYILTGEAFGLRLRSSGPEMAGLEGRLGAIAGGIFSTGRKIRPNRRLVIALTLKVVRGRQRFAVSQSS
jgi:hypothetical protein